MKTRLKRNLLIIASIVLITSGLLGVIPALYYSNHGSAAKHGLPSVSAQSPEVISVPRISGHPVSVSVPAVNISNPVIDGFYDQRTRTWTLSHDSAQFAVVTQEPNNISGNTFIYGHANANIFYHLYNIKVGDEALVMTDNGYVFKYKLVTTYATDPTDSSVLHYQGPPILTLQTCSGTWFQNRQMYVFSFESYQKA